MSKFIALLGSVPWPFAWWSWPKLKKWRLGSRPIDSISFHWKSGKDESHSETSSAYSGPSHNPDGEERRRLRVRWGKPSMGFHDYNRENAGSTWKESTELRPGRMLVISGTLLVASKDGKELKPAEWVQGLRVVVARAPNARPVWEKRHEREDSTWADCVTQKDGAFRVTFSPDDLARSVGTTANFQIGLCLGSKTGRTIIWKNTKPILPQSVATVGIPGPPTLRPILQVINASPSVIAGKDFNPVLLIRAVNKLHPLGKEKALAELRAFLEIARRSFLAKRDPANIDTSDYQSVFLIVRLLFEPMTPKDKIPWMYIGAMSPAREKDDEAAWPLFPLTLQDDIPFNHAQEVCLTGSPEHPSSHLDWAEKHGKLRPRLLRPADNPLLAAEKLAASPLVQRLGGGHSDHGILRRQAWQMVEHLVLRQQADKHVNKAPQFDEDAEWEAHKKLLAGLKIKWDEQRQEYVAE